MNRYKCDNSVGSYMAANRTCLDLGLSDNVRHMMASPALLEIVKYIFYHFQILYKIIYHIIFF